MPNKQNPARKKSPFETNKENSPFTTKPLHLNHQLSPQPNANLNEPNSGILKRSPNVAQSNQLINERLKSNFDQAANGSKMGLLTANNNNSFESSDNRSSPARNQTTPKTVTSPSLTAQIANYKYTQYPSSTVNSSINLIIASKFDKPNGNVVNNNLTAATAAAAVAVAAQQQQQQNQPTQFNLNATKLVKIENPMPKSNSLVFKDADFSINK